MLSRGFQRQGDHDALNVVPFLNDQSGVEFADGPEHHVLIILARMLESVEGLPHLVIDRAIREIDNVRQGLWLSTQGIRVTRLGLKSLDSFWYA